MDSIVREDERTKFTKRDGEKISYGRYVKERYGVKVLFKERCVIKTKSGAAFLPQFLNITATNEQIGNDGIEGAVLYQAINSLNAGKKYPLWGSFEDILIKSGYPLYRIIPNLPDGNKSIFYETKRFLTIGINVTGNTSPTVAVMACINDPYNPSLEHYVFHGTLLPPKKDVIGVEKMEKLALHCILEGLRKHIKLYHQLPKYLVVMRSGVATGQIASVQTKEIAGIKRAIYRIRRDKKNRKELGKELQGWKPSYFVVMINKRIAEKVYAVADDGQFWNPNKPIVVQSGITSSNIWDCVLHIGGGTKAQDKWNPTKMSVLEYPEEGHEGEFRNLVQMIHALHYGFGFSVPFPMGPGSLPAPIHFCQHYAEWLSEMILERDIRERDLEIDTNIREVSKRPRIVFHHR